QSCERSDCSSHGSCLGTKLAPICICDLGYTGLRCETGSNLLGGDSNALCESKDCNGNGLCTGTKAAPTCLCSLGYSGLRCEIAPLCNNLIACSNNGLCLGTAKTFTCLCNLGFTGPHCAQFVGK
ncbi:hypothetical protein PENTCL1PPCAC_3447, partial [Pristionchus entomophagus]